MKSRIFHTTVTAAFLALGLNPSAALAQPDNARLAALETRISAIERDTAQVEALTQIQRIQRAFGYYLDKGYFGEAADLFTDNGRVQYGVDGVYIGKQHIKELFTRHGGGSMNAGPGLPYGRFNMHMQLQPMVTVAADGNSARARWREWALLGQYEEAIQWGDAILENDYVKENGVWKVAEMRYYTNFVAPYEGGPASLAPVTGDWKTEVAKAFPADAPGDVSYQPFPNVYIPPYHYANDLSAIRSDPPLQQSIRSDDAIGRLEAMADTHAAKLARVRSLRAVENLQSMYGYYIDKGQWAEAVSLFSDDGTWEFGQWGVFQGKASIARGMTLMGPAGLEQGQLNNYPMLQAVIHVSEDNSRALGRFRSDVMLARKGTGRWGGGVYENEYVNDNGTWKISKQHYWVTFWGDYDKGWTGDGIIPVEGVSSAVPPDAPPTVVYESLPNTFIIPFHYDHPVTGRPHDDLIRRDQDPREQQQ